MNTKHFIAVLSFVLSTNGVFAQEAEAIPTKPKRFHLGVNFGTGHADSYSFMGQRITDNGYSTMTALEAIHFDLGYVLSDRYSIIGGFAGQNLSLRYVLDDNAYRYNGGRVIIPLGMRLYLGPDESPASIIFGLGGYYAFDSGFSLISNDGEGYEETKVFNGFGFWSTIGFSYALTSDIGFSVTINALSDFTANVLRINTGMLSFGFYVRPF
ncbi:MAG: hypothetical protein JJU02_15555 [Cryomorphaceae bacterium]|nr:hypothetical protein [Cryomorphaceae bacterium]